MIDVVIRAVAAIGLIATSAAVTALGVAMPDVGMRTGSRSWSAVC